MRVIKIDLPASMSPVDPEISLVSDEVRGQLFKELAEIDTEMSEVVRQRARSYFPEAYSVFVRTILLPDRVGIQTELWIVDPNIRWPAGLLTRSAWKLFVPIFAHVVREAMTSQMPGVKFNIREQDAKVSVFAPTRTYKDPLVVAIVTFVLTSAYWLLVHPHVVTWLTVPVPMPVPH
jgi:hypothetical protein